jgi:hypothetical protein
VTRKEKSANMSDEEFAKIPAVRDFNRNLKLLEAIKEMHSGELFCEIKLTDIAERFSAKMGETYSSLKVAALLRKIMGDWCIMKRGSRYYAMVQIDILNKRIKEYAMWRV